MPYFTSWDINTYLSLLSWGLPEDVVKRMMKMVKEKNRSFCLERDKGWHCRMMYFVRYMSLDMLLRVNSHIPVIKEYKERLRVIEPKDRYDYYVWAYENFWYKSWNSHPSKKLNGFHPGRLFLMDLKRGVNWIEIRKREREREAWNEERFIRRKKYIDDMFP